MTNLSVPCLRYKDVDSDGNPVTENFDLVLPKEFGVITLEPGCAIPLNMLTYQAYLECETDLLCIEECDVEESSGAGPFKVSSTFVVEPIPSTNNQLVTVTCVYSDGSQTVTTEVIEDLDNTIIDADVVFINGEPFMQYTLEDGSTFNVPLPVECCTYFEDQTGSDYTVGSGPTTTPATKNENDTIIEKYDNGLAFFKFDGSAWVEVMFCEFTPHSSVTHEQLATDITVDDTNNGDVYVPASAPGNPEIGDDHYVYGPNGIITLQFDGTDWIVQDVDLSCCPDPTVAITFDATGTPDTTALNGKNTGTLAKGERTVDGCVIRYVATVDEGGAVCMIEDGTNVDHNGYKGEYASEASLPTGSSVKRGDRAIVCETFEYEAQNCGGNWILIGSVCESDHFCIGNTTVRFDTSTLAPTAVDVHTYYDQPYLVGDIPTPRCNIPVDAPQARAKGYRRIAYVNLYSDANLDIEGVPNTVGGWSKISQYPVVNGTPVNVGNCSIVASSSHTVYNGDPDDNSNIFQEPQEANINSSGLYNVNQGGTTPVVAFATYRIPNTWIPQGFEPNLRFRTRGHGELKLSKRI